MKLSLLKIQSVLLIIALALSLNSCSYTKNTGSAGNFNKKHYNKGFVKNKSIKKDDTEILATNAKEEKLSKKEQKEALKVQVEQYVNSKGLTASSEDAPLEQSSSAMVEKIEGNFSSAKANLTEAKLTATAKESNKIDKKINRIEKIENMLGKISSKMEAKMTPDPDAAPPADRGLLGLLAGIFGIAGLTLAFVPYIGYLGLLLCITAIILGVLGLQGDRSGWAIAGIILGALGFLIFFLALLVLFTFLL
jgi:hypothetical protein